MKKWWIILAMLVWTVSGCRPQEGSEIAESVMPENLVWEAKEGIHEKKENADVIEANRWDLQELQEAVELFLIQGEEKEENTWDWGLACQYKNDRYKEYLNLELNSGALGYGRHHAQKDMPIEPYQDLVRKSTQLDLLSSSSSYEHNKEYGWRDLEFSSRERCVTKISDFFREQGFDVQLREGYSLEKDALAVQYERKRSLYQEQGILDLLDQELPTEEGYLLLFQQMLGDIPCMPHSWKGGKDAYSKHLYPSLISVIVMEEGIVEFHTGSMVIPIRREKKKLIPYAEAKETLCRLVGEQNLEGDLSVVEADLYYVGLPGEGVDYKMTPCWSFAVYWEYKTNFYKEEGTYTDKIKDVIWYVLDAVTGEWVKEGV